VIILLGASGYFGKAFEQELLRRQWPYRPISRKEIDYTRFDSLLELLRETKASFLINAAGFTGRPNVDACETERDRAFLINAEAPGVLAEICNEKDAKLIHFSTDYVFDGEKRAPYTEEDQANPISAYGESKFAGEKNVLAAEDGHLVVRVSWVFGPDRPSFIDAMIKRAQQDEKIDAISDKFSTPTYTHDIAEMLPQFFDRAVAGGILHFANAGKCTWQEYAQWALDCCRDAGIPLKARTVGALKLSEMTRLRQGYGGPAPWVARRPVYSVLSAAKYTELTGTAPRAWREAVNDYITRFYSKK